MLLFTVLAACFLPLCFASIESDYAKLVKLSAANNGLIKLDEHSYNLLTAPNRNWSAVIQFTAMDSKRRCTPCREFDPSFNAVAKAWSSVPRAERDSHFFGTLDFDNAMAVFQKLGLQSAPVIRIFPATDGPRRPASGVTTPISYDPTYGFEPAALAEQLSKYTPVPIPYKAPFNWGRLGTFAAGLLVVVTTLRFISPILRSRWTWAVGTVLTCLVMTSGYMFVRIRGMPTSGPNGQWIAPGFQNQFGQEVQVLSMIYGLLGFAFFMLTVVVPYQPSQQRQRFQVYLWSFVIFVMFSILVSIFKVKNRGYPFKLLL